MKEVLQIIEIILAILLMTSILLQQRGTGLGGAFGGEGFAYRGRRGVEGFLFNSTVVLAILFTGVAIAIVLVIRS